MHPKKRWRPMVFFTVIDPETHEYFTNKSQKPDVSCRHLFSRSRNKARPDYDSDLFKWLRTREPEDFIVTYSLEMLPWCERRAHYCPPSPTFEMPQIISYKELYEKLVEEHEKGLI